MYISCHVHVVVTVVNVHGWKLSTSCQNYVLIEANHDLQNVVVPFHFQAKNTAKSPPFTGTKRCVVKVIFCILHTTRFVSFLIRSGRLPNMSGLYYVG